MTRLFTKEYPVICPKTAEPAWDFGENPVPEHRNILFLESKTLHLWTLETPCHLGPEYLIFAPLNKSFPGHPSYPCPVAPEISRS